MERTLLDRSGAPGGKHADDPALVLVAQAHRPSGGGPRAPPCKDVHDHVRVDDCSRVLEERQLAERRRDAAHDVAAQAPEPLLAELRCCKDAPGERRRRDDGASAALAQDLRSVDAVAVTPAAASTGSGAGSAAAGAVGGGSGE